MGHRTADEAKQDYIDQMGSDLGACFAALWQETALIHQNWLEYVELYGTSPARIDLLNKAAPSFFRMVQDMLWDHVLLHIARLTDQPTTGRNRRENLTIQSLPSLISNIDLRTETEKLIEKATSASLFCRDLRNRKIAHCDLNIALERQTAPLPGASRLQVKQALAAITDVLNLLQGHYSKSETRFDVPLRIDGARHLIHLLEEGICHQETRRQRMLDGHSQHGERLPHL